MEEEAGVQGKENTCSKFYQVINWQSWNSNSNLPDLKAFPATTALISQGTKYPLVTTS